MKRTFDLLAALTALTILAVPLALIALAVWLEDRHSPLYRGARIGRGGSPFRMLKFRSMHPEAWKSGVNSTASGDPRITGMGKLLRRAKLDELPQLWNVLIGQMSLAGPRPQVAAEVALYTQEERRLLAIRPGVTDLASIVFADEAEILAGSPDPDLLYNQIIRPWKSRLGLAYIDHASLPLDLRIILLTLLSACSRDRALDGVTGLLESWNSELVLIHVARRRDPLLAWPPPGATEIVSAYPSTGGPSLPSTGGPRLARSESAHA
jgi:lipopolysaccharide/colanic/teichoic acid biosynthesis glycosyltransferase